MNCKEMKTEGDHDWVHHSTTLMAFVPPTGEPKNDQQVRTVEYFCRTPTTIEVWSEQCGATKTVIIKVGTNPQKVKDD